MPRILFLSAGIISGLPELRVGREAREVRAAIASVDRDYADLRVEPDVGRDEVLEIVLGVMPDIIHFSGHGEPGSARFENGNLPATILSRIVAQVPQIWCVVLNSCYSDSVAKQLGISGVPAVVGMKDEVMDDAAIVFSRLFYRALAEYSDIKRAVEQSKLNLKTTFPKDASTPKLYIGNHKRLAERSRRHARPELRARFCVDDKGSPEVWKDHDGIAFVTFDLYVENSPRSASSVIYRLDESYNDAAKSPEDGQFHEVTRAADKFYLPRIDSEDDYTVEAYIRWNDGRTRMLEGTVTEALTAHYARLSPKEAADQRVDRKVIDRTIVGLKNGNIQFRNTPPRRKAARSKGKKRK